MRALHDVLSVQKVRKPVLRNIRFIQHLLSGNGCKGCQADCLDSFSCPKYVRRLYRAHATVGPFSVAWCSSWETVFASSVMWPASWVNVNKCQENSGESVTVWQCLSGRWPPVTMQNWLPRRGNQANMTHGTHTYHVRPRIPRFCNDLRTEVSDLTDFDLHESA